MDNTIIVLLFPRVLVKIENKGKENKKCKVETLVGMLKEYKDKYMSVELQKVAMKWWKESV